MGVLVRVLSFHSGMFYSIRVLNRGHRERDLLILFMLLKNVVGCRFLTWDYLGYLRFL